MEKFKTIYRERSMGKTLPRVGGFGDVRPGDVITWTTPEGFFSGVVKEIGPNGVRTCSLYYESVLLEKEQNIHRKDICSAQRKTTEEDGENPLDKAPTIVRDERSLSDLRDVRKLKKPRKTRERKQPPADLLAFLDDTYHDN